jgi:hypothetical protein
LPQKDGKPDGDSVLSEFFDKYLDHTFTKAPLIPTLNNGWRWPTPFHPDPKGHGRFDLLPVMDGVISRDQAQKGTADEAGGR